jgi:hypothetical protein
VVVTDEVLYVIDVNSPPETNPRWRWPMNGYDPQRTACLDCPETVPTSAPDPDDPLPTLVRFAPVAPNPFSGGGLFRYSLPVDAVVRLEIFDLRGRRLREIVRGEQSGGEQTVRFDGRDRAGRPLSNGSYVARLTVRGGDDAGSIDETVTRKFSVLR